MSPSICGCSSISRILISCSLLTFCIDSLIYLFYGDDICCTCTLPTDWY
jgi:hypothetical protein